ncbi:branched-chain amino acid ABC transporter permease [Pseudodesulfovibrio sediminis]|uniref:Branched-chain amino acid ABC transporter permease n=1 Tax=Pseudodesulfovibrio sediminis TaxID=2810563 RepID=A0ABN6EYF5_9BACT|nr:branched-chain amino acid ABC transporter permease [Pseudodesulfovibrio sediminis]BCS89848.1 branched-chain amino acid ABC transporter permease [Pseudodesulfovibrio sediminis]
MDTYYLMQIINGLSAGMIYALIAIGFTLIFGVLNVVNFAHGEMYTIGAFGGLVCITALNWPLALVIIAALAAGGLAGIVLERLAFKPFRRFQDEASLKSRAMREATLLSSLAVSIIVKELIQYFFGAEMQSIPTQYLLNDPIPVGPLSFSNGQFLILGSSILMLGGLQYVLYRTRIGLSIRAISNNPLGAKYVGLSVDRTIIATFAVGSMMGGAAGILVGLYYGAIFPSMGFAPSIKAFVAMVMGGLSSIPGAVVCALILGVCEALATDFMAQGWSDMVAYAFLILTLIFFPQGIFGARRERV